MARVERLGGLRVGVVLPLALVQDDGEADGDDNETIMMTMVCTYVYT